jgi:hypothetical protein
VIAATIVLPATVVPIVAAMMVTVPIAMVAVRADMVSIGTCMVAVLTSLAAIVSSAGLGLRGNCAAHRERRQGGKKKTLNHMKLQITRPQIKALLCSPNNQTGE